MSALPEPDPISSDRRRARRRAKLPDDAACVLCGATDVDMLTMGQVLLLEEHHVLGRRAAPDVTVPLCKNHHAVQTGLQHDLRAIPTPGPSAQPDSLLDVIAKALTSLAAFVHDLAHALIRYATQLRSLGSQLDVALPSWRDWELLS